MRRAMLLGVATVLLAMAVALIAASVLLQPSAIASHPATGNAEIVRRFYAAANDAIATGNPARLRAVVAAHFVDEAPLPGMAAGRDGLEAYIAALHATDPGMQLVVEGMVVADDRVVARVGIRSGPGAAPLGGSIVDQPTPWGAVDIFRVAGGAIVERWSQTNDLAMVRPLAKVSLDLPAPAPRVVTIERITLASGTRWDAAAVGPRLLFLEEGALLVEIAPSLATSGAGSATPRDVTLSPGGSLPVSSGDRFGATNLGQSAVRLLVVTLTVPQAPAEGSPVPEPLPSGVTAQTLAGGLATQVRSGPVTLALGQVTLARDARLSLSSAAGPILNPVDAGHLGVTVWGAAWRRRGSDGMNVWTNEAALPAGDSLLLEPDSLAALRNAGDVPVELLVLTVQPAT